MVVAPVNSVEPEGDPECTIPTVQCRVEKSVESATKAESRGEDADHLERLLIQINGLPHDFGIGTEPGSP
jgi:hypothetical protein